jgi:hypothetical protein
MAPLVRKTRTEVTVTYVSRDFAELANLLTAPVEFIRSLEFLWLQTIGINEASGAVVDYCAWQMLGPIVANIKPIGLDKPSTYRVLSDMQAFYLASTPHGTGSNPLLVTPVADLLTQVFGAGDTFRQEYGGMFVLKFALYTSTIDITYIPPADPGEPT